MKDNKLTKRQLDVMKIFWNAEKPLLASEIVGSDRSLNINTVQAALKALQKNGFIEMAGIEYSGTVLSRSYAPLISADEYVSDTFSDVLCDTASTQLLTKLVERENSLQTITELENLLHQRRLELEKSDSEKE